MLVPISVAEVANVVFAPSQNRFRASPVTEIRDIFLWLQFDFPETLQHETIPFGKSDAISVLETVSALQKAISSGSLSDSGILFGGAGEAGVPHTITAGQSVLGAREILPGCLRSMTRAENPSPSYSEDVFNPPWIGNWVEISVLKCHEFELISSPQYRHVSPHRNPRETSTKSMTFGFVSQVRLGRQRSELCHAEVQIWI